MSASDGRSVVLTIPAREDCVGLARLTLAGLCAFTSLSVDEVSDVKLALSEAAQCFLDAGSQATINFALELSDSRLVIKISGPRMLGGGQAEVSRYVLDSLADECEYGRKRIRLVKYLDNRRPAASRS